MKRHGQGTHRKRFFLGTTLMQKGIWNNGQLVASQSDITEGMDFLLLIIKNIEGVLFLVEETLFSEELKQVFQGQFLLLQSKLKRLQHQEVYPMFVPLFRMLVALGSLQNILYDVVKLSKPFIFKERVLEGPRLSAELS
mmetsp:Transcript_38741/g.37081  ORF Transcript_38741/g.37081 Transcript_38741/m.37081 type:complete len:139 (-) Transcript_38741:1191-1607(-)